MSKIKLSKQFIQNTCKTALNEDLFPSGDVTSDLMIKELSLGSNLLKILSSLLIKKLNLFPIKKMGQELKKEI